ncbi:hypothetical protein IB267_02025 [Ensifer sp. ENS09]|uniref:hypothetical protein n=1 Tax=Ensifer sp. ENS09 TaxID=2769263 RepID=UPI0017874079|nr:hypothetical protein [Ensifer sp. ENS09]MBD9647121.1 hypothetical protein [Ensifer sp. ENS09]
MERLLGEGWELSVFQEDGRLSMGIPVDCGHWSKSFDFDVSERDYEVLLRDRRRRKTLEFVLHERLQDRMAKNDYENLENEMHGVIRTVLHGSAVDVEREISASRSAGLIRIRLRDAGFEQT